MRCTYSTIATDKLLDCSDFGAAAEPIRRASDGTQPDVASLFLKLLQ